MKYFELEEFVEPVYLKNGRVRLQKNKVKEGNLYSILYQMGFRIKNNSFKQIYRVDESGIHASSMRQMRRTFIEFLKSDQLIINDPSIRINDVINWFMEYRPIKQNDLLIDYLSGSIFEELSTTSRHHDHA